MSILQAVALKFEAFAAEVIADATAEAVKVGGQIVETVSSKAAEIADDISRGDAAETIKDLKEGANEVANEVKNGFLELVDEFGKDAAKFVHDLMGDVTIASGNEKANLAATQLVDAAAAKGINIAAQDVTTLIKNAFLAVNEAVAKL